MLSPALLHIARPLAVGALAVVAVAGPVAAVRALPASSPTTAATAMCVSATRTTAEMRSSAGAPCSMPGSSTGHAMPGRRGR